MDLKSMMKAPFFAAAIGVLAYYLKYDELNLEAWRWAALGVLIWYALPFLTGIAAGEGEMTGGVWDGIAGMVRGWGAKIGQWLGTAWRVIITIAIAIPALVIILACVWPAFAAWVRDWHMLLVFGYLLAVLAYQLLSSKTSEEKKKEVAKWLALALTVVPIWLVASYLLRVEGEQVRFNLDYSLGLRQVTWREPRKPSTYMLPVHRGDKLEAEANGFTAYTVTRAGKKVVVSVPVSGNPKEIFPRGHSHAGLPEGIFACAILGTPPVGGGPRPIQSLYFGKGGEEVATMDGQLYCDVLVQPLPGGASKKERGKVAVGIWVNQELNWLNQYLGGVGPEARRIAEEKQRYFGTFALLVILLWGLGWAIGKIAPHSPAVNRWGWVLAVPLVIWPVVHASVLGNTSWAEAKASMGKLVLEGKDLPSLFVGPEVRREDGTISVFSQFDDPRKPWVYVELKKGRYEVRARGSIDVFEDTPDARNPALDHVPPTGVRSMPVSTAFPFPTVPSLGLVGRIGRTGPPEFYGGCKQISLRADTVVGFTMNDDVLDDNGGEGWTIDIVPLP